VGRLLGRGAFGKVNVGVHRLSQELTALKVCERRRIADPDAKKSLMQEVTVLQRLNGHPNVVQLFEVIETDSNVLLVTELAAGGDLLRYVRHRRRLVEDNAQELFRQLLDGIRHMHSLNVVHRDIKLENLLLDNFGCLKIADLGVAVIVESPQQLLREQCGTPSYLAPEVLLDAGYEGPPVDVWGAGVCLYAMLMGRVPFKGEQLSDLKRSILKGRFQVAAHMSHNSVVLVQALLTLCPAERATVADALSHAWLEGVENKAMQLYEACPVLGTRWQGQPSSADSAVTEELLRRAAALGFPREDLEPGLREGQLNAATATFRLLFQQRAHQRAAESAKTACAGAAQG